MQLPKSSLTFLLMPFLVSSVYACYCYANEDAARWDDSDAPADRLEAMCAQGVSCYQANIGLMCVDGDLSQCGCAVEYANAWQSWHGDWFLWSAITCDGLSLTIE